MTGPPRGDPAPDGDVTRVPARPVATAIALLAQLVLLGGVGLYAVRADWSASTTGLLTVVVGPLALLAGSALWWFRGSWLPLALVDLWLALYGASILVLASLVDRGGGTATDTTTAILGTAWLGGGIAGAIAAWRTRR